MDQGRDGAGSPQYSAAQAAWFVDRAREEMAADPGAAKHGLFNSNVRVADPDSGEPRNVRMPEPIGEREPIAWRTAYHEAEVYQAMETRFDNIATTYYAAEDGSLLVQGYETEVRPFPPRGTALPGDLPDQLADTWRDMLTIPLRPPAGRMPPDFVRYITAQLGQDAPVAVPRSADEYRRLHLGELEAASHLHALHWDGLLHALGFPYDPVAPARKAVASMSDVPLKPGHPDLHLNNLGVKNDRIWIWDPELVGWHDPHHTLAMMVHWGHYPAEQQRQILDRARSQAPPDVAAGLLENVALWRRFATVFDAVKQVGRVANRSAMMTADAAKENLAARAPRLTERVNAAGRLWGNRALDVETVREVFTDHVRAAAEHRRMVGVAALGLGVHVAAPTVFAAPPAWEHRNSPSTGLYSVPRAGGHGLVKQAVLDR